MTYRCPWFIFISNPWPHSPKAISVNHRAGIFFAPFYRWEDWGTADCHLHHVTQHRGDGESMNFDTNSQNKGDVTGMHPISTCYIHHKP